MTGTSVGLSDDDQAVADAVITSLAGDGARLRDDLHSHSDWSDGGSPIDEMVLTAVELGQEWMVLTDHSPRLRIANGLSAQRLAQQLDLLARIDASLGDAFTVMSGIEVDILDDGGLDQTPEMLARLDLVTASVHSKLKMARGPMTARMVAAEGESKSPPKTHAQRIFPNAN